MKQTVRYACGHGGAVYAAEPLNALARKRAAARPCPDCAVKGWKPITRTLEAYADDHPRQKRKPRRVNDNDLAGNVSGQS